MRTIKRVIVMTDKGQIVPLNIKWYDRFSIATNVKRYVLPLIGCKCIVAVSRAWVWVGSSNWHYKFETQEMWQGAISAQKNDNTLWQ